MGNKGASSGKNSGRGASGGNINSLVEKAKTASPNSVLNSVPDNELGKNFQNLSYSDKQAIKSVLRLTPEDVEFLSSNKSYTQSQSIRINGTKYNVIIGTATNGNIEYSVKKGNKIIINKGTYKIAATQLAVLSKGKQK